MIDLITDAVPNRGFKDSRAATNVNGAGTLLTKTDGRALVAIGGTPGRDISTSLANVIDNLEVPFTGWRGYRTFYNSGNSLMGLFENGARLGKANLTGDGQAFLNSSDHALVSDALTQTVSIGDVFSYSLLAGNDSGSGVDQRLLDFHKTFL